MSRRGLIKQATAVGAAAVAAGLVHTPGPHRNPPDESLVVRVADARTGELDFFRGR